MGIEPTPQIFPIIIGVELPAKTHHFSQASDPCLI